MSARASNVRCMANPPLKSGCLVNVPVSRGVAHEIAQSSGQHGNLLALDQLEIDGGAQAWSIGNMHQPVAANDNILFQAVFLRRVGQQDLEELGVSERGDDVQVGDVVQ